MIKAGMRRHAPANKKARYIRAFLLAKIGAI
jgi:hypothetical protein